MSEYEQVIDEIVKHGVVVKVNKIVDDNYIPCERKYVGCVVELDFSEHDKPFEDKIEKLEKELSALRRRCNSEAALHAFDAKSIYRLHIVTTDKEAENAELKKRISELDMISDENKYLKQHIAELEREKSEKPVAYVLAKEIDGQHYVTVEDFMSVVNNLQRQRADWENGGY